ncbi:MAG TPA: tetratricopeptide repeat protein [Saprospiraceae bacterium]|nr:tetratricopeptide repeat protein [Saprospiraceae bacterium]
MLTKKISFFLLVYFFLATVSGQNTTYDSLITRHRDTNLPERERLKALSELGQTNFLNAYPDSLVHFYEQSEGMMSAWGDGQAHIQRDLQLSAAYFITSQREKGLKRAQRAEKTASTTSDTASLLRAIKLQGNSYAMNSDFKLAIDKYSEALILAEQQGNQKSINGTMANLGVLYSFMEEYEKARYYFYKVLEDTRQEGNILNEIRYLMNIGVSYRQEKSYDEALHYLLQAQKLHDNHKISLGPLEALLDIETGQPYFAKGQVDTAKAYYLKALALAKSNGYFDYLSGVQYELAKLYRNNQPDSARYYARQAEELALKKNKNIFFLANVKELLIHLHEDRQEYKEALTIYKEWQRLQDTIYKEKNQRAVYQAEARYEYEKQKMADAFRFEQELIRQEIIAQRRMYILGSMAILILTVFVGLFLYHQKRAKQEYRELLLQIDALKERLVVQSIAVPDAQQDVQLDREQIESYLGKSLGESSWTIITTIFENPSIGNRELAEQVYLSADGLSSALRRMYKAFKVKTESSRNKKVALLSKVVKISLGREA